MFPGPQSLLVPSSSMSYSSLLVQHSSKSTSSFLVKPSSKLSQSSLVKQSSKSSPSMLVTPSSKSSSSLLAKPSPKSSLLVSSSIKSPLLSTSKCPSSWMKPASLPFPSPLPSHLVPLPHLHSLSSAPRLLLLSFQPDAQIKLDLELPLAPPWHVDPSAPPQSSKP